MTYAKIKASLAALDLLVEQAQIQAAQADATDLLSKKESERRRERAILTDALEECRRLQRSLKTRKDFGE